MVTPNTLPDARVTHPHAAESIPIPTTASPATLPLYGSGVHLAGISITETTGAARAEIAVFDGQGAGGTLLLSITLTAGESDREFFPHPGIAARGGLALQVLAGSVKGAVWFFRPSPQS